MLSFEFTLVLLCYNIAKVSFLSLFPMLLWLFPTSNIKTMATVSTILRIKHLSVSKVRNEKRKFSTNQQIFNDNKRENLNTNSS